MSVAVRSSAARAGSLSRWPCQTNPKTGRADGSLSARRTIGPQNDTPVLSGLCYLGSIIHTRIIRLDRHNMTSIRLGPHLPMSSWRSDPANPKQ